MNDSFFYPYVTKQVGGWTQELAWSVATSYAMAVIGVLIGAVTIIRIWKKKHDELTGAACLSIAHPVLHRGDHGKHLLG